MATKTEPDYPSSPPNDESDGDEQGSDENYQEDVKPVNNNVADILKRLQSTGALIKKPKQEYHCFTCNKDFSVWETLENHLIQHVQLPSVVLERLPSDDDELPSDEDGWSDDDMPAPQTDSKPPLPKLDISQILKKTNLSIKPTASQSSDSAINKLSGLGFTIKKNTPIKKEPEPDAAPNDVMQKLGKLGGIKLKLKLDSGNSNSFKVVNGLKDFKASDDEEDEEGDDSKEKIEEFDSDEEFKDVETNKVSEQEKSGEDDDWGDELQKTKITVKPVNSNTLQSLKGKTIVTKIEPAPSSSKVNPGNEKPIAVQPSKIPNRPLIKQTPKRGANLPLPSREMPQIISRPSSVSSNSTPERTPSQDSATESVVVKKEVDTNESQLDSNVPLFSGQIKAERSSPPLTEATSSPQVVQVKSEPESVPKLQSAEPIFSSQTSTNAAPLLPVTKTEDSLITVIEINGDSNDEDDDCCVVSATPASDIKPILPKAEPVQQSYPPPAYPTTSQASFTSSLPPHRGSTEKQHSFNWNAPDSKPSGSILEKSAEDIFESLLSGSSKKDCASISEASEYVSLDTLGPQHSCEMCNTRFTSISLLEDHKRQVHSSSLVPTASSNLLPYNPNSSTSILQSLLPVKHMVEQVGKLSSISSGPGFTHQQNVMINIQAYPGAAGSMVPPQSPYGVYNTGQTMPQAYPQSPNNMYGAASQQMSGQYPSQNYMGQQNFSQFQPPLAPKNAYPGSMSATSFDSPFSAPSPLQSMQQAVYGQAPTSLGAQIGSMGPPPVPTSNPYIPSSGAGVMKPPSSSASNIKIQNIQTFPPTSQPSEGNVLQMVSPGQVVGGQMPSPSQIRMPGSPISGPRQRMPMRGPRPTIRPGVQVQGQIRGMKPRMPLKRPVNIAPGPMAKKRPNVLLPRKHDNEDCQVMSMQKQREGLPLIHSVQGANDKLNLGSQISITKKTVNKEANAMANVLASRGISVKQKQRSRSPTPERPVPHIPNLGAGVSIKHTSKSSNFSIPEAKVGGAMVACKICKRMFMSQNSLSVHMTNAHPQNKMPMFKCEECPASYPKILQLQHHKRVFHNAVGLNREFGLPVVDMSQEDNLQRLRYLGINTYIPLAGKDGGGGCFAIPIISVHSSLSPVSNALQTLGADGLLSLGPIKSFPNT